jgi:ABC-type transporter Mla subunit MlaD
MNNEKLRTDLEHLRGQLQQAGSVDPQQRELLQTLANDIHQLLDGSEPQPRHYRKLSERLNEAVAELEASHPQITRLMRQAINSLAYLGI